MFNLSTIIYNLKKLAAIIDTVQITELKLIQQRLLQYLNRGLLSKEEIKRYFAETPTELEATLLTKIPGTIENFLELILNDLRNIGYQNINYGAALERSLTEQNLGGTDFSKENAVGSNVRLQTNEAKVISGIIDKYITKYLEDEELEPGILDTLQRAGVKKKLAEELLDQTIQKIIELLKSRTPTATKFRPTVEALETFLTTRIQEEVEKILGQETEEGEVETETEESEEVSPYLPLRGPLWRANPLDQY